MTPINKNSYSKQNPYPASNGISYWVESDPRKGERLGYVKGENLPRYTTYFVAVGMLEKDGGFSFDTLKDSSSLEELQEFVGKHGLTRGILEHISTRTAFWRAQKNEVEAIRWAAYGQELRANHG